MSHSGAAVYKKTAGIITIREEVSPAELTWRSTDGDRTHRVALDTVDKLQATPRESEKMMLRLVGRAAGGAGGTGTGNAGGTAASVPSAPSTTHMFSFNNRDVMDRIKETLQQIIFRYKDSELYEEKTRKEREASGTPAAAAAAPAAAGPAGSTNSTGAAAAAPLINTSRLDDSLSTAKLLANFKLQQSLLRENKDLMRRFQEAVIALGLSPDEFWSTRISQLRAFALATSQKLGPYNVLSTIKPVASSDNKVNVNVSREKILSIFQNFPIVKKAYTDNVPKNFKEPEFWARFFSSKLFRKLRGERIMHNDRGDVIIDRYLTLDQEYDRQDDVALAHPVRRAFDVDGNEQDNPVRRGNRADMTMQPGRDVNGNSDGVVDILRGMNRLSEKMMCSLENEYSRAGLASGAGGEENEMESRDEVVIDDLVAGEVPEYALLRVRQKRPREDEDGSRAVVAAGVGGDEVRRQIGGSVSGLVAGMDLVEAVGEQAGVERAQREVVAAVRLHAKQARHKHVAQVVGAGSAAAAAAAERAEAGAEIPADLLEGCRLLHSTCCEFLKHFFVHFQSGEARQASAVRKLYLHLKDCEKKIYELLGEVSEGDGEHVAEMCRGYLGPVMAAIALAIGKYDEIEALIKSG